MQNVVSLRNMMYRCMVFGEIVGQIDAAFAPIYEKLVLSDAIANPVKTHINGFGSALFHGIVGDTTRGSGVGGCG